MIEGARGGGGREDLANECILQVLGNWINTKQEKRNSSPLFWKPRAAKLLFLKQIKRERHYLVKKIITYMIRFRWDWMHICLHSTFAKMSHFFRSPYCLMLLKASDSRGRGGMYDDRIKPYFLSPIPSPSPFLRLKVFQKIHQRVNKEKSDRSEESPLCRSGSLS